MAIDKRILQRLDLQSKFRMQEMERQTLPNDEGYHLRHQFLFEGKRTGKSSLYIFSQDKEIMLSNCEPLETLRPFRGRGLGTLALGLLFSTIVLTEDVEADFRVTYDPEMLICVHTWLNRMGLGQTGQRLDDFLSTYRDYAHRRGFVFPDVLEEKADIRRNYRSYNGSMAG